VTRKARKLKNHIAFRSTVYGLVLFSSFVPIAALYAAPDAGIIIQRSVDALKSDWQAEPEYDHLERDVKNGTSRTYRVVMILGSPYRRMESVNGTPLSPEYQQEEQRKMDAAIAARCGESKLQTRRRIENYNKGRQRDHLLMQEMTKAFVFDVVGETNVNGRDAWHLRALPKPGYQPPGKEAKALTGMEGELWIDKDTFQWIKVVAQVIHPVSIDGLLARVEPGTRFRLVQAPVAGGAWFPSEFSFTSKVRVLSMIEHNLTDDETYSDYQAADSVKIASCPTGARGGNAGL